jgi:hypothetical protein
VTGVDAGLTILSAAIAGLTILSAAIAGVIRPNEAHREDLSLMRTRLETPTLERIEERLDQLEEAAKRLTLRKVRLEAN